VVTNERCIQVFVEQKVDLDLLPTGERVPKTVNRRPTDVVAVGNLFAWDWGTAAGSPGIQALTGKRRPAMGGDSIGHFAITAGTAGTGCYDQAVDPGIPPRYYILSNNHVLANSNDANLGDAIYQPGPYDGGGPADQIGNLHHYVPIRFDGTDNLVDAAVAEVPFHDFTREIYYLGYVAGNYAPVVVGDLVKKTGRTTNFTTGRVISVAATVNVNYGGGKVAKFVNQIITTAMSAGGDSGSLVLDTDNNAVGLLFAGSSVVTIINNIQFVQALLNVRLTED
nr:serine protease [Acidimicrobiia bacterium]